MNDSVCMAVKKIIAQPLSYDGIDQVKTEFQGMVFERITNNEMTIFRALATVTDVSLEDERKAVYTIRKLLR